MYFNDDVACKLNADCFSNIHRADNKLFINDTKLKTHGFFFLFSLFLTLKKQNCYINKMLVIKTKND